MKVNKTDILNTIILIVGFSSCQKVIDLKLNSSSSQIVIQGNVYDQAGPYTVKISQSVNFDESSVYPPVTGAVVAINDDNGNSEVLTESPSGTYTTSNMQGLPGHTYTLNVTANGKTYTASSTMPFAVNIDSVYTEKSRFGNEKLVTLQFTDPAGIANYYRLIQIINGVQQKKFDVTNDALNEGETLSYSFTQQGNDSKLESGDEITIWLESIDKSVYEYFRTAGREGGQSASPSNPTSNINNGALGYFNACSVRKKLIIVP
jgi:hypothetical protein